MQVKQKRSECDGIKLYIEDENGQQVARAFLYILRNDLRERPFGFMEDVFVDENQRGKGLGKMIVNALVEEAKKQGCYKIVASARHGKTDVHAMYEKIGFKNFSVGFKMYLDK